MTRTRIESVATWSLYGCAATVQISIAATQILFAVAALAWLALLVTGQGRFEAPRFFRPLAVYAVLTLVAAVFSLQPWVSLFDSRQLLLFLMVPIVFTFARRSVGRHLVLILITVGAASAIFGIVQYGVLHYDHLGQRPQGVMGHYMTYSGLLMLVTTTVVARVLFVRRDRMWPSLVLPALLVALVLSFTRSAWVGACAGMALLLLLKDFRLLGALPVVVAIFFALAPPQVTQRFYSMFDLHDPTNRDRIAMLRQGGRMIAADPLTGMGPNMVEEVYVRFRDTDAIERVNPHLHNVPMQIAAERGLPALGVWLWFVGSAALGAWSIFKKGGHRFLAAGAMGALAAMLAAGFFEHNFGDSEFLMLLLILITLPFAAGEPESAESAAAARGAHAP
ncbi:MAG: O-antigen ligase family protein [Vicinamibacterales bacterium]|nr:O-antigen ligase family protein [Vicinamibacterales bacterium]